MGSSYVTLLHVAYCLPFVLGGPFPSHYSARSKSRVLGGHPAPAPPRRWVDHRSHPSTPPMDLALPSFHLKDQPTPLGDKQGHLLVVLSFPPAAARVLVKPCLNSSSGLLNFYWFSTQVSGMPCGTPAGTRLGPFVPSPGADTGPSGTTKGSFPGADRQPPEPLVSASPCLVTLPSSARGPWHPHSGTLPPPLGPFPSPETPLHLLSLSLTISAISCQGSEHWTSVSSFLSAWGSCSPKKHPKGVC